MRLPPALIAAALILPLAACGEREAKTTTAEQGPSAAPDMSAQHSAAPAAAPADDRSGTSAAPGTSGAGSTNGPGPTASSPAMAAKQEPPA